MDHLIARGVRCVTVVDVSGAALRRASARLPGAPVNWIEADVTGDWTVPQTDIWHDRAAFHFLTDPTDRARYLERLSASLNPDGQVIMATFALDAPPRCSGLEVVRYSPDTLAAELGSPFRLVEALNHQHHTPMGAVQAFWYCRFVRADRE